MIMTCPDLVGSEVGVTEDQVAWMGWLRVPLPTPSELRCAGGRQARLFRVDQDCPRDPAATQPWLHAVHGWLIRFSALLAGPRVSEHVL
jgi:hypothetical protein